MQEKYDHKEIEKKWQKEWKEQNLYKTPDEVKGKENFYTLVEFPYPSGNLHIGHWYAFAVPDIFARAKRMQGYNVMFPIGFDAFGLPAENAAIKNKVDPRKWTYENIAYMEKQLQSMGNSFDWSRKVITSDPEYYKWTQWLFLKLYEKGLAYKKKASVNWCPKDNTVLANEQVIAGKCERCGTEVVQKDLEQWFFKITDYAERLLGDLDNLKWPEAIKEAQRNWIGKSEGTEIEFEIKNNSKLKYVLLHGYTGSPEKNFFPWLKKELEKRGHEVVVPKLPNTDDPIVKDQVEFVLKNVSFDENTVLVGHSLGGVDALKILEKLKKPIYRTILIGSYAENHFLDEDFPEYSFDWKFGAEKIKMNAGKITLLRDLHDTSVPQDNTYKLHQIIGGELLDYMAKEPHFCAKSEPTILKNCIESINVFTTRIDTLFGVTYLVVAPEHPVIENLKLKIENWNEVEKYIKEVRNKTEIERTSESREKTGVKLGGVTAVNPANGEEVPVFVADYVLGNYGTGAVMAVPAHDDRDFEFAKKYGLPIKQVIAPHMIDLKNPPREGKKNKPRTVVQGIVRHWKNDEVIQIVWKKFPWKTFIIGGAEYGESLEDAVKREVMEETGYKNFKSIRKLSYEMRSEWYAEHKDENRYAHMHMFELVLADGEKDELSAVEKEKHDVIWVPFSSIPSGYAPVGELAEIWEGLNGEKTYPICFVDDGVLINSGEFNEMKSEEAREKITERFGEKVIKYKLRDWLLSRQRYWGCPIPVVYDPEGKPRPVPEEHLPWLLPEDVKDFAPKGESPLTASKELRERVEKTFDKGWKPEADTMDTFVDSSWYFNRYADPHNEKEFSSKEKMKKWLPVNRYSGGAEHTTMHLLYSRFFHKALFDLGFVNEPEPFTERMNRGLILGPDGQKMSKSRGNVVDPDEVVERVGADTVKMYLAFIGPYNEVGQYPWDLGGVVGTRRFLERVWKLAHRDTNTRVNANDTNKNSKLENLFHKTIKKVTEDIENYKFNTAISAMMIFLNELESASTKGYGVTKEEFETFLKLLAPFAPHMTEEIWHKLGNKNSIHLEEWPKFDEKKIKEDKATIVVQINGKVRAQFEVEVGIAEKDVKEKALSMPDVQKWLDGKEVKKAIFVPNKIINFVV